MAKVFTALTKRQFEDDAAAKGHKLRLVFFTRKIQHEEINKKLAAHSENKNKRVLIILADGVGYYEHL